MKKDLIGVSSGLALVVTGVTGILFSDKISEKNFKFTKLNKNIKFVTTLFGAVAFIGAIITAIFADDALAPVDEEEEVPEDAEAVTE